jgi:hypothetical protein
VHTEPTELTKDQLVVLFPFSLKTAITVSIIFRSKLFRIKKIIKANNEFDGIVLGKLLVPLFIYPEGEPI